MLLDSPMPHPSLDLTNTSPIFIAVQKGNLKFLEENVTHINEVDTNDNTLLHYACGLGQLDIVKWLLNNGAGSALNLNTEGENALHFAIYGGYVSIIKYLLNYGAFKLTDKFPGEDNNDTTYLQYAAKYGQVGVIHWLLQQEGVDVDEIDAFDETALHYATKEGHFETVRYLVLTAKADVNAIETSSNETALHYAAHFGFIDIVKFLIDEGHADSTLQNTNGENILHLATNREHFKLVKWLVEEKNYKINTKNNNNEAAINIALTQTKSDEMALLLHKCYLHAQTTHNDSTLTFEEVVNLSNKRKQYSTQCFFTLSALIDLKFPNKIATSIIEYISDTSVFLDANSLESFAEFHSFKAKSDSSELTNSNLKFKTSVLNRDELPTELDVNMLRNNQLLGELERQVQSQQSQINLLQAQISLLLKPVTQEDKEPLQLEKSGKKQKSITHFFMPELTSNKRPRVAVQTARQLEF